MLCNDDPCDINDNIMSILGSMPILSKKKQKKTKVVEVIFWKILIFPRKNTKKLRIAMQAGSMSGCGWYG